MTTINPALYKSLKYVLLILLMYMPIFGFLDTLPIRLYDEGRIAINAQEMYHDGDYIVTHFSYTPEMWNTKPPFLIWCQVFFMKLIGVSEIAIRLPTSLAVFFTCLALLLVSVRYLRNFWLGFIIILLLLTSDGYMNMHIARTGDYDAMLTLFTTVGCLFFYTYCETKKTKYLYLFFAAATLGVLTKGIAGFLFFPALTLYCLFQKQLGLFLKNKHFYIGLISFLILSVGYYFLRETQNPGYLQAIWENELGGRYMVTQGENKSRFWFYYDNFVNSRLSDRYLLIPCGLVVAMAGKDPKTKKLALFITFLVVTYFLIISSGKTRLEQYDAPLFPLLSILTGLFIHFIFELLRNSTLINQSLAKNVLPFLFLFLIFVTPYKKIWPRVYLPEEAFWDVDTYEMGYFLKGAIKGKHELRDRWMVFEGYKAHNDFYIGILSDKGITVRKKDMEQVQRFDTIFASQPHVKQYIRDHYVFKEKNEQGCVTSYTITDYQKERQ